MLDFTALPTRNKFYAGANGAKIAVIYDGEQYMLKFPAPAPKNKELSYANSCISEYIGCHIFNSVGIAAQETLLGIYRKNGAKKIVVACKDFTSPGIVLQDFASLKNTVINSGHSGYGTELSDITQAMEDQTAFPPALLKQHFWDMFIVDALIGNWDRHNGNWGFLYNTMTDEIHLAPVYDCGSSLYPQADESIMRNTLESQKEQDLRTFSLPLSGIKINGQRINYFNFISSLAHSDCNAALKRILPRINMEQVFAIIDETPLRLICKSSFIRPCCRSEKSEFLISQCENWRNGSVRRTTMILNGNNDRQGVLMTPCRFYFGCYIDTLGGRPLRNRMSGAVARHFFFSGKGADRVRLYWDQPTSQKTPRRRRGTANAADGGAGASIAFV